jgi:chromosome segregation ATPase
MNKISEDDIKDAITLVKESLQAKDSQIAYLESENKRLRNKIESNEKSTYVMTIKALRDERDRLDLNNTDLSLRCVNYEEKIKTLEQEADMLRLRISNDKLRMDTLATSLDNKHTELALLKYKKDRFFKNLEEVFNTVKHELNQQWVNPATDSNGCEDDSKPFEFKR